MFHSKLFDGLQWRSTTGGLGYDHPVEYRVHSDYSSGNTTLADNLWESIDSSPIIVALSDNYARKHKLETSARFPWDDAKGIYHIKAFHHLHCLVGFNLCENFPSNPTSLTFGRNLCARPILTSWEVATM